MTDTFGFDEFIDALGDLEEDFIDASQRLLEETGDLAVAETQARTPVGVDTPNPGNLRRSMARSDIQNIGKDMNIEVGSDVEYAKWVEDGHKTRNGGYVSGRHMLKDGVKIAEKYFDKESEKIFKNMTKGFNL